MVVHNPSVTQYWIEFTRMEMETGCYANARLVVDTGLRLAPNNIFLLTKKLKIADKQGDTDAIEAILDSLFASDRQKAIRVLVEAVSSLARLGRFGSAMAYVQEAMKYPAFFTGWFLCELIVFVVPTFSVAAQLDLLPRIAGFALKHSPLWALCLDLQEHITALRSPLHSAPTLPADPQYDALCLQAFAALSSDSVWKVYQIRVLRGTQHSHAAPHHRFRRVERARRRALRPRPGGDGRSADDGRAQRHLLVPCCVALEGVPDSGPCRGHAGPADHCPRRGSVVRA